MSVGDYIGLGSLIVALFVAGLMLIQYWSAKVEAREKMLQDRDHEISKELAEAEKNRINGLFAGMAAAMKQLQDQAREDRHDRMDFSQELRLHRSDLKELQTVTKIEMEHVKASLVEVREEVKSMVKYIGEGKVRVSGPKF